MREGMLASAFAGAAGCGAGIVGVIAGLGCLALCVLFVIVCPVVGVPAVLYLMWRYCRWSRRRNALRRLPPPPEPRIAIHSSISAPRSVPMPTVAPRWTQLPRELPDSLAD